MNLLERLMEELAIENDKKNREILTRYLYEIYEHGCARGQQETVMLVKSSDMTQH